MIYLKEINKIDVDEEYRAIKAIPAIENGFETDNPYFVDMKLDVCIPAFKEPTIMDEDDLKEVLDYGMITKLDYDNAYITANKIINYYNNNKDNYYNFIRDMFNKMNKN